jgi:hypothetical protein
MSKFHSKKFAAFIFSMTVISGLLFSFGFFNEFNLAMSLFMSIGILGLCSLAIGYVLTQSALDRFLGSVKLKSPGVTDDDL